RSTFQYSAGLAGAKLFYDRVLPQNSYSELTITVSGVGYQTNSDVMALYCSVSNASGCGYSEVSNTGANAWLQTITKTWCLDATPGAEQRILLYLMPTGLTNTVYLRDISVIVDGSTTADGCGGSGFQVP
ncbi:hypothetical protein, partial [Longivirga aurantiaca]